jgi:ABC-type transport system substrate-binding protein
MKIKFSLLLGSLLLLMVAAAASASPAATPAAGAPAPDLSAATPACGSSLSTLSPANLTPAQVSLSALQTCGSCSSNPCKGATLNQVCRTNAGGWGACVPPLGNNCSDGITWQCQCWYGPLP